MKTKKPVWFAIFALLGVFVSTPRPCPATELQERFDALAQKVKKVLNDNMQSTAALVEFTGPNFPASSSGPGIQQRLVQTLSKLGVAIDQKAALTLEGRYLVFEDNDRKDELLVRLRLNVTDRKGDSKGICTEDLTFKNNDDLVKILALQVDLSDKTKALPADRNKEIKKQLEKPPLKIDATRIKTSESSPFAVEVLVRKKDDTEFKIATPQDSDGKGQAFIELDKGDVYRLRLHNGSTIEAAVSVTIDGLDAFDFFEDPAVRRPTSFLVGAGKHREVTGWTRSTEKENEFLVGAYSDSAAAKLLRGSAKVGTITLCFHPCWTGTPPSEYEGSRSVEPNATGLGKEVERKSKVEARTIGPLVAAVTIRYNK